MRFLGFGISVLLFTLGGSGALAQVERAVPQSDIQLQLSFSPIVKNVAPAVVNVYATTVQKQTISPFANDPFFSQFFGENSPFNQQRQSLAQSLGSGVIVDPSGLVLTNSHVVSGATDIKVTGVDGHEYDVELVLDDPRTDLAALRIVDQPGKSFPFLEFADTEVLEVGDLVLAVGNPFGVGQTVTSGIVSALARTGIETSDISFFIQTDAAINPGNSGGALVDMQGRLVGINTAIFSKGGGGSVGIGFAIPSEMSQLVASVGLSGEELIRPWFGARLQDISADLAVSLGLEVPRGAMLAEVAIGGAAERAGLVSGDVVVAIDGRAVDDPGAFEYRIATKQIGGNVEVEVIRSGENIALSVDLEPAPSQDLSKQLKIGGETIFSGIQVAAVYPTLAQEFGLAYDALGALVLAVDESSRAYAVGLRTGDLLIEINGVEIDDVKTLEQLSIAGAREWRIVIQRDGRVFKSNVSG